MAEESPFELYLDISYAIIGAFAGMSYGMTRLTADLGASEVLANIAFKNRFVQ